MATKKTSKTTQDQSIKELIQSIATMKTELHGLRMKNAMRNLKETHTITVLRKNIARASTLLTSQFKKNNGNNR
ncbi:MAG TPA: 50S ribosomal protein L29 [Candidatus Absconditabacterales bacterium]|nr:50S ribosomal protein L29 [Candidatus Absconditabacterales bacterium]HMT27146.1 50S ribosomal protein L29 [Candidatus Absconditabacterales bacterium]